MYDEFHVLEVLIVLLSMWGAFHLRKKTGKFGGSKSGISDW